jgi:hypothetical protein
MSDQQRHAPRWKRKRANLLGYIDEYRVADELGIRVRTLRLWRAQGRGPAFIKIARQIHYSAESLAAWLKRREVQPIREQTTA